MKVLTQDRERVMGLVVDAVYETYHIAPSDIRTAPELGTAISSDYIGGLAAIEERMVVILDIDRLMNSRELAVEPALVD